MSDDISVDKRVDKDRLDEEWVEFPGVYHDWCIALADSKKELDEAKTKLEVVKAELYKAVCTEPQEYGLAKTTEKAIDAAIPLQPEYMKANRGMIQSKHEVAVLEAAVATMDGKRRALENLVTLHGRDYFSSPRVDVENKEVMDEVEKKHARRLGVKKKRQ